MVLTRAYSTTRDSKGRSSTSHYLHVVTRQGAKSIAAARDVIGDLVIGEAIIAFERWGHLEAVWRSTVNARDHVAAAASSAPAAAPAQPTSGVEEAKAKLAAVSPADVERASATKIWRPWTSYVHALGGLGLAAFVLFAPAIALRSGDVNMEEDGAAERIQILKVLFYIGGGLILAWSVWSAVKIMRRPLQRQLCVVLARYRTRSGSTLTRRFDLVTSDGTVSSFDAGGVVFEAAPIGTPVVAVVDGRTVISVVGVARAYGAWPGE